MSFISTIITDLENTILSAIQGILTKAEKSPDGKVSADELRGLLDTTKDKIGEAKSQAESHKG